MKRWLLRLLIIFAVLLGLMLAAGFAIQFMLSGSRMQGLVATASEQIGAPLTVSSVNFNLAQWFRFRPAVALNGVTIANPQGFPTAPPLLEASKISAQVALV